MHTNYNKPRKWRPYVVCLSTTGRKVLFELKFRSYLIHEIWTVSFLIISILKGDTKFPGTVME